jgi:hypothetical protein
MERKRQATIERTLLIGVVLGLLIGFFSKRIAYGLLLGIGLSILLAYLFRTPEKK